MKKRYATMLTLAGSDSGGGAGIQADLKTASALGVYGASAITSLTAQNTLGVSGIHLVPADFVRAQAEAVLDDIGVGAVKIGMLPTPEIVDAVAELIEKYDIQHVVLDPVMIATSGDALISREAIRRIVDRLIPLVEVVTPNIPEAECITGLSIGEATGDDYRRLARAFFARGARAVLLKSGHLAAERAEDILFMGDTGAEFHYPYTKTPTPNTHGTGCTLSSAIASLLALGAPLAEAVGAAEEYVHRAVAAGAAYTLGRGHGPVHHFWRWWE